MQKRLFCTFWIAEHFFGVDILDVKEINQDIRFTPIFHAPKVVKGYVNIRGRLHLILDQRVLLGIETRPVQGSSRLILFKPEVADPFGILVDRVGDVVEVDVSQIETPPEASPEGGDGAEWHSSNLSAGVCKLEDGLLVILNSRNLLKNIW